MQNDHAPVELFDFLDETHQKIAFQLDGLGALVAVAQTDAWTSDQSARAYAISDYFDTVARQHHLDEEKHVFPALLASDDPKLQAIATQLQQDHGWLEGAWIHLQPMVMAYAQGQSWVDVEVMMEHFQMLRQLYREHMQLEESIAYPGAQQTQYMWDANSIGREMARRRAFGTVHQ